MIFYLFFLLFSLNLTLGFDAGNFKKCDQSSFCKRQRSYSPETSPYVADFESLKTDNNGKVMLELTNIDNGHPFNMEVWPLKDGSVRVRINEATPLLPRFDVPDTIEELKFQKFNIESEKSSEVISLTLNDQPNIKVKINCHPLRIDVLDEDEPIISLNSKNQLKIEHLRKKSEPKEDTQGSDEEQSEEAKEVEKEEEEEPGMWEETFKSHTDKKPRGPESIGIDTCFFNFTDVYGVPEHADQMSLKDTSASEPYRLYNLDVFEYELDSRAALYGSIPLIIAHNTKRTVGLLWLNSAETWVDVQKHASGSSGGLFGFFAKSDASPERVDIHWMSESGLIDVFVMTGPQPKDVMRQYTTLTGTSYMPPEWSIAYHQSRWNYKDEQDVEQVDAGFDESEIPYDCLWLDIEHTNGKRYFTWDTAKFPNPIKMQDSVAAKGRKMVTIIDPHIKADPNYHIYSEAQQKNYFVKDSNDGQFKGWCWSGDSSYLDFTLPSVREWWASQFSTSVYQGSTHNLFTWNDMNEPSVFNGPEVTMHKDAKHGHGWEHRHVHNMYGSLMQMSTFKGLLSRSNGNERPFVLSRAFFVGTQKYGAIWTGDNTAKWSHLAASVPMLLTISLSGIAHCGADIGGFFGNPDAELLTRWYQAAFYQPFARSHAHIDTARREPFLYDEKHKSVMREAVRQRYELLPYWYTLFYHSHKTGEPPMRPLWYEFPSDTSLFSKDDSFMVGSALLVQPVTSPNVITSQVYLPGDQGWYDVFTKRHFTSPQTITIATPLEKIAVLQRGGSVIPRKMRVRRSSSLMIHDPYTLFVALDHKNESSGDLYMDDGRSYEYQSGSFNQIQFSFKNSILESRLLTPKDAWPTKSWLERVVVMGTDEPKLVTIQSDGGEKTILGFEYEAGTRTVTIRKPAVNMASNWLIELS